MNKTFPRVIAIAALLALLAPRIPAAQKIYWGDSVSAGWNGKWPAKYLTVPEKTNFARTASSTPSSSSGAGRSGAAGSGAGTRASGGRVASGAGTAVSGAARRSRPGA